MTIFLRGLAITAGLILFIGALNWTGKAFVWLAKWVRKMIYRWRYNVD